MGARTEPLLRVERRAIAAQQLPVRFLVEADQILVFEHLLRRRDRRRGQPQRLEAFASPTSSARCAALRALSWSASGRCPELADGHGIKPVAYLLYAIAIVQNDATRERLARRLA
jgi:hypothetical protein